VREAVEALVASAVFVGRCDTLVVVVRILPASTYTVCRNHHGKPLFDSMNDDNEIQEEEEENSDVLHHAIVFLRIADVEIGDSGQVVAVAVVRDGGDNLMVEELCEDSFRAVNVGDDGVDDVMEVVVVVVVVVLEEGIWRQVVLGPSRVVHHKEASPVELVEVQKDHLVKVRVAFFFCEDRWEMPKSKK